MGTIVVGVDGSAGAARALAFALEEARVRTAEVKAADAGMRLDRWFAREIPTLAHGRLVQEEIESLEELSRFQPIWVDLESPTLEEKRWIKQYYGLSIPEDAMDEDIEESARFYEEDNGELHIRSDFLIADEDEPRTVRCAFILNQHNANLKSQGVLFSIHDEDVPVFRLLRLRARRALDDQRRLQRGEIGMAVGVERHHFGVDDRIRQRRGLFGDGAELVGPVLSVARVNANSLALCGNQRAIAVELDFMEPLASFRHTVDQCCKLDWLKR